MMCFLKGLMLGALAGLCAGLSVSPHSRRKLMRSAPCRALRSVCCKVESLF